MDIGMLWFDNDKKSDTISKVQQAAAYYRDKYGKSPNLCYVHPVALPEKDKETKTAGIAIHTTKIMLPDHFWIGVTHTNAQVFE